MLIEVCAELHAALGFFESDDSARAHIKQRSAGQLFRVSCDVERDEIPGSLLARSVCGHNALNIYLRLIPECQARSACVHHRASARALSQTGSGKRGGPIAFQYLAARLCLSLSIARRLVRLLSRDAMFARRRSGN